MSIGLTVGVADEDPRRLGRITAVLNTAGAAIAATGLDALVMSLDVASAGSAALLREAVQRLAPAPVVVVSPRVTPVGMRRALEAGAEGIVVEEDLEKALVPALLSAAAGQISVPRQSAPQLMRAALTSREKQVLRMAALGLKNFEIGQRLYLAESTVKSHLSSAFTKLGVGSRSEATALLVDPAAALRLGIASVAPGDGEPELREAETGRA